MSYIDQLSEDEKDELFRLKLQTSISSYGTRFGRQRTISTLEAWLDWLRDSNSPVAVTMDALHMERSLT